MFRMALGVQHALLLDGLMAMTAQAAVARTWLRAPLPVRPNVRWY
jgi:hypothetical protein